MDWNQIQTSLERDDRNKWDSSAYSDDLEITEKGLLEVRRRENGGPYRLSDLAIGQMCQRLEIPARYYRRLPGSMKATVANFDLSRNRSAFLLRGKGEMIRAFLSNRYVAYDNSRVIDTLASLLPGSQLRIRSFVLEETQMYVKITSEEIVDASSGLKAGVMVGNSEVGMGSVSVEPFVFRLACTNDLVVTQEQAFRHAHLHLTEAEFSSRVAKGLCDAFEVGESVLDRFLDARRERIDDPLETIRRIAERRKLSQTITDETLTSYQADPHPSRFGVINAFTSAAKTLAPLERIEMERFAGSLLSEGI